MTAPNSKPRWYHLTPERFLLGLLLVQVFLLLSERRQWFAFTDEGVKKLQRAWPNCTIWHESLQP